MESDDLVNMRGALYMRKYKWVVWVGGVDDYFSTYWSARTYAEAMLQEGYDDVKIEEVNYD